MAITCLDGTALDERIIKVGIDPGFKQGRQYGRGMSGGQVSVLLFFVISCRLTEHKLQAPEIGAIVIGRQTRLVAALFEW